MSGMFILECTTIVPAVAQESTEAGKTELTVTGTVRDRETRKKLENVTVALAGTSIGTVTNAEGIFSLKIPNLQSAPQLELSHIGYQNTRFSATAPEGSADLTATIWMTPVARQLDEVVIYGGDARCIVEEALKKNPSAENMMSAFYRETAERPALHRYLRSHDGCVQDLLRLAHHRTRHGATLQGTPSFESKAIRHAGGKSSWWPQFVPLPGCGEKCRCVV